MDALNINFSHCVNALNRELLGDDKCKQIILEILRERSISALVREATRNERFKLQ